MLVRCSYDIRRVANASVGVHRPRVVRAGGRGTSAVTMTPKKDGESSMAVLDQQSGPESESTRLDRAYRALKQGIIDGTYQQNQRLTEMELSQALGVSRPTARQALVRLEQEGLVV